MNNNQEGYTAIKETIIKLAGVRFKDAYTLYPSQKDNRCTLFRLDLSSGETIDLTLSRVQIELYLANTETKEVIDNWIKKRLEAVECPSRESVKRAS